MTYLSVECPLKDMLEFFGIKKINHFQRKKFSTFLKVLPFATHQIKQFDDQTFSSVVAIPAVAVNNYKQRLIVSMTIDQQLLEYSYPFSHSDFFLRTRDSYERAVKLMIIRVFNQYSPSKEIPVKRFLQRYKSYAGSVRKNIKSYLLEALQELKDKQFIKPYYILRKNKTQENQEHKIKSLDNKILEHVHK